jgi:hypothetical protein
LVYAARSASRVEGSTKPRVPAQMWQGRAKVPVQMWQGRAKVPVQMWQGRAKVPAQMWQPSPGSDTEGASPSPGADVAAASPSPGADVAGASPSAEAMVPASFASFCRTPACTSSAPAAASPALQRRPCDQPRAFQRSQEPPRQKANSSAASGGCECATAAERRAIDCGYREGRQGLQAGEMAGMPYFRCKAYGSLDKRIRPKGHIDLCRRLRETKISPEPTSALRVPTGLARAAWDPARRAGHAHVRSGPRQTGRFKAAPTREEDRAAAAAEADGKGLTDRADHPREELRRRVLQPLHIRHELCGAQRLARPSYPARQHWQAAARSVAALCARAHVERRALSHASDGPQ